jgi:hypothetical protein
MPPARLLITAVLTRRRSRCSPEAPPELIRPARAHVAVQDLVAAEVDRVIAGAEVGVDALVGLAVGASCPCSAP